MHVAKSVDVKQRLRRTALYLFLHNLGREQRRGRRWSPAFWKSTRELFFTQGGSEKRAGHASVDPVLQQHTLGREIFPLAMARLAPKTRISVGRRQDGHQEALSHRRNFSAYKNIFRNSAGFHHRNQSLHLVLAQGGSSMSQGPSWKGAEASSLFVSILFYWTLAAERTRLFTYGCRPYNLLKDEGVKEWGFLLALFVSKLCYGNINTQSIW